MITVQYANTFDEMEFVNPNIDHGTLKALVTAALKLNPDRYTPNSWAVFRQALGNAQATLGMANTPQSQINSSYKALLKAKNGLSLRANKASLTALVKMQTVLTGMPTHPKALLSLGRLFQPQGRH